ncbi:BTB POZ domain-containing 18 [Labeo rohita]|uniref:BTB POZ domain-containing 18 n=1 Tax=Labeo rohita TaxID=84645 RepID=A0A498N3T7_LABRO|nr:BTB POZ domain-containing 18 [Labeo rohita]
MLTFETLLVKELQKQQSRAEFCDIVLQTRGVSVPVHSCVLSAFSPWLCGALSAMPSTRNGQRRLIEVQAVEACTLLNLVSLLYSGQLNEDKEEVLSAACKLGIDIPQQVAKRPSTEQNTQTECMKEVADGECQTETVLPECQKTIESVNLIGTSSWRTEQGFCTYTDGSDITLATVQTVQGNPDNMPLPSFQVMDVVPESAMYPTANGPACLPQVYVCPPTSSYQQPPTPLPPHPYPSRSTNVEGQPALGGISEGEECVVEAFSQFENNIPGFINYFLDTNIVQGAGQREQSQRGMRGNVKTEGRSMSEGERLMEDSYSRARFETADSLSDSPLQRCSTEGVLRNMTDKPFVSHAQDPTTPLKKLGNAQESVASSEEDEDVDVVEVSSSLSESFSVLPVTADMLLSTGEEDSDEDNEIDVISLGSS